MTVKSRRPAFLGSVLTGRAAALGIANSNLIEYDGAPHGLFASHKQQLISDLLAFLQKGSLSKRAVNQA